MKTDRLGCVDGREDKFVGALDRLRVLKDIVRHGVRLSWVRSAAHPTLSSMHCCRRMKLLARISERVGWDTGDADA